MIIKKIGFHTFKVRKFHPENLKQTNPPSNISMKQININHHTLFNTKILHNVNQPNIIHKATFKRSIRRSASKISEIKTLKEKIKTLCKDAPDSGASASPEFQNEIKGYLQELIKNNPIKKPVTEGGEDGKLDGMWCIVYTNGSGISTGRLGPFYNKPYQVNLSLNIQLIVN